MGIEVFLANLREQILEYLLYRRGTKTSKSPPKQLEELKEEAGV